MLKAAAEKDTAGITMKIVQNIASKADSGGMRQCTRHPLCSVVSMS